MKKAAAKKMKIETEDPSSSDEEKYVAPKATLDSPYKKRVADVEEEVDVDELEASIVSPGSSSTEPSVAQVCVYC